MVLPTDRLKLSQGEDIIVLTRRELRGGDSNIADAGTTHIDRNFSIARIGLIRGSRIPDQPRLLEVRFRGNLYPIAHRKAEPGPDAIERIISRNEADLLHAHRRAEIDLNPFLHVLLRGDGAMVSVLRPERRSVFRPQFRQAPLDPRSPCTERALCFGLQFALLRLEDVDLSLQVIPRFLLSGIQSRIDPIRPIHCGEDGLKAVVILHLDRIELVMVALRALHRGALEDVEDGGDHLVPVEVFGDAAVEFPLPHFNVADQIPRSRRDKSESGDSVLGAGKQDVTRDLFLDELGERFVAIQTPDDIVAIRPGIHARLVLVITVSFCITRHIEPMPRPGFPEGWRGQQAIRMLRHRFGQVLPGIANEGIDFSRRRRQSGQVIGKAADQGHRVRLGRWREFCFGELCSDEGVNRLGRAIDFRNGPEAPPIEIARTVFDKDSTLRPWRAGGDPVVQHTDLGTGKRLGLLGHLWLQTADRPQKLARCRIAGDDGGLVGERGGAGFQD